MNLFLVLPVALALSMDAFAVSVGISLSPGRVNNRQAFRLAFHFGFFQFMMPLLGWLIGQSFLEYIRNIDHWVALGLLFFIGSKMIYESFKNLERSGKAAADPTKGKSLIMLSVATSIDALAVGLSFAALRENILYPSIIIGLVAFMMTLAGTRIGPIIGKVAGRRAEFLGGLILILMGIKIFVDHS